MYKYLIEWKREFEFRNIYNFVEYETFASTFNEKVE